MSSVFRPRRILLGARAHAEIAAYIRQHRPDLEVRGAAHVDVTEADLAWADVYIGFRRPLVPGWGSVRWVHCTGAGVDAFVGSDPLPPDILLTRTSEPFGPQIAEFCVARALAVSQRLRTFEAQQRAGEWRQHFIDTLAGSRVLILGTGEVGSAIARAFTALGCIVRGVSRSGRANDAFTSVRAISALGEEAGAAQFLILAVPNTPATHHLVNGEVLSACSNAVLINVGRGQVLDQQALVEALDAGRLRAAALDVFESEPLPAQSPLWARDDVYVSPHVSGLTTVEGAGSSFLESLASVEAGGPVVGAVDRERGY